MFLYVILFIFTVLLNHWESFVSCFMFSCFHLLYWHAGPVVETNFVFVKPNRLLIQFCFLAKARITGLLIWITGFSAFEISENGIKTDCSSGKTGVSNFTHSSHCRQVAKTPGMETLSQLQRGREGRCSQALPHLRAQAAASHSWQLTVNTVKTQLKVKQLTVKNRDGLCPSSVPTASIISWPRVQCSNTCAIIPQYCCSVFQPLCWRCCDASLCKLCTSLAASRHGSAFHESNN